VIDGVAKRAIRLQAGTEIIHHRVLSQITRRPGALS